MTLLLRGGFRRLPSSGSSVATESEPIFERENATLVFLSRNSELKGVLSSMRSLENRFNHKYQYPWVFLNDEEFTNEFKGCVHWICAPSSKLNMFVIVA